MGTLPREWRIPLPSRGRVRCESHARIHVYVLAAHLPTTATHRERPLRRNSRCNCVNYTTHMIRIAFNYSSICEILSPSSSPSSSSCSISVRNAQQRGVRIHSMVMRDERKGKRHEGDHAVCQIENMFLLSKAYLIYHAMCVLYMINLVFIS
jgi:hypothetical protein